MTYRTQERKCQIMGLYCRYSILITIVLEQRTRSDIIPYKSCVVRYWIAPVCGMDLFVVQC